MDCGGYILGVDGWCGWWDGGGYILACGGWWCVVVDIFWLIVGGGRW